MYYLENVNSPVNSLMLMYYDYMLRNQFRHHKKNTLNNVYYFLSFNTTIKKKQNKRITYFIIDSLAYTFYQVLKNSDFFFYMSEFDIHDKLMFCVIFSVL